MESESSDLLDWAQHEHEHLSKLFEDLGHTFGQILSGELEGDEVEEALEQALEDLSVALEDMLEHFGEEEEFYFVEIEQKFPHYASRVELLVQAHERICAQTRELEQTLKAYQRARDGQSLGLLVSGVKMLAAEIQAHNTQEQVVFEDALRQMSVEERRELMEHKRALGG